MTLLDHSPTNKPKLGMCQRCHNDVVTHNVRSDIINMLVCIDCARDALYLNERPSPSGRLEVYRLDNWGVL